MIVNLTTDGWLILREPENLSRLHCELVRSALSDPRGRAQLEGVVELANEDEAWIDLEWMRTQAPQPSDKWLADFEQMVLKAKPYGWISPDGRRAKAHIVWSPEISVCEMEQEESL